jgi:hypothetical protein
VVKRIKDRVHNKFNVSIAEVDDFDLWQRATLGVAVMARDGRFADQVIAKVVGMMESEPRINLISVETELR